MIENPFTQRKTISYVVFAMAIEGTTLKKIEKFVIKKGSDIRGVGRLLRILRKEEFNGKSWRYIEKDGNIRVESTDERKARKRK